MGKLACVLGKRRRRSRATCVTLSTMSVPMPMSGREPSAETLAAIAALERAARRPGAAPFAGVANHVFLLGEDLVVRIPRAGRFLADLVKEAEVIPVAVGAGVWTPRLVAFDDTCSVVDVPYMVLDRVRGDDLARLDLPADRAAGVLRQVGRNRPGCTAYAGQPGPRWRPSPCRTAPWTRALIETFARGRLARRRGRPLADRLDRPPGGAAARRPAPRPGARRPRAAEPARPPGNVPSQRDRGLGRRAVGGPCCRLRQGAPDRCPGGARRVYREESGEADAPVWEARVLWYHLTWAPGPAGRPRPASG